MEVRRFGDRAPDIMEIKATLRKLDYGVGQIDRVFDTNLLGAIARFQTRHGLTPDGVLTKATIAALRPYMIGAEDYIARQGDSIQSLSSQFGLSREVIAVANPRIDFSKLKAGTRVVMPYYYDVVDTDVDCNYAVLERDIEGLKTRYPFLKVSSAGTSVLGKHIYTISIGEGKRQVFINGAHHALEWITVPLIMKFIEQYAKSYVKKTKIGRVSAEELYKNSTLHVIPMVNPDGVDLVVNGLADDNPYRDELIGWNGGSRDFSSVWQANIRGVDLNHNYNALWDISAEEAKKQGIEGPGPTKYGGPEPESEPESHAVAEFTRAHGIDLAIAYHSQGEEIFWTFLDQTPPESWGIGQMFALISGYELSIPEGLACYGGYKDWFIQEFGRSGYTIEVGMGKNPLPLSQFDSIYLKNAGIMAYVLSL